MKIEPDECFAKRCSDGTSKLPIVPNYLKNPVFPYSASDNNDPDVVFSSKDGSTTTVCRSQPSTDKLKHFSEEDPAIMSSTGIASIGGKNLASEANTTPSPPLVLRVRVSGDKESDFVEVELPSPTYSSLLKSCCEELEVATQDVTKIRKLPNVVVRKDKDVQRLKEGQELEIILNKTD